MGLRPTRVDQVAQVVEIERSTEVSRWVDVWPIDRHIAAIEDLGMRHLIWELDTDIAGYAILSGFDNPHGNVELIRVAVATPGSGQGRPLVSAVTALAFDESPRVHRVWLDVFEDNHRALAVYESIGYRREGVARAAFAGAEGRKSLVVLSLLRPEWETAETPTPY